jgi:ribosomal protein S18 acetylase RimI-like enzyme
MTTTPSVTVQAITRFRRSDLEDICQATEDAIRDGIGFNWQLPPAREMLEAYWKGVLLVPERELIVGKLDETIVAAIQLFKPSFSRQTTSFIATIETHFVAPWARGHGLAKDLLRAAERSAIRQGYTVLRLDVRASQKAAIQLYESCDYRCWGILDEYEVVGGAMVPGHFFVKDLRQDAKLLAGG